jgi:hypothetical protein
MITIAGHQRRQRRTRRCLSIWTGSATKRTGGLLPIQQHISSALLSLQIKRIHGVQIWCVALDGTRGFAPADYVVGDHHLWSRLRASRSCGGWPSSTVTALCPQDYVWPLEAHPASCRTGYVIGDYPLGHGFLPCRFTCRYYSTPGFMPYRKCVRCSLSLIMACAYRFYVSLLMAHEALCHAGNMTSGHRHWQ